MKVERFRVDHWPDFSALSIAMHAESAFGSWPLSLDKLRAYLDRPNVFCSVAINDAGEMIGLAIAAVGSFFFSERPVVDLAALYVKPYCRGGRAAKRLVESIEQWAMAVEIPDVQLSQRTGVDMDRTARFFEGMGYKLTGFAAQKDCNVFH